MDLLKGTKSTIVKWTADIEMAFQELKQALCKYLVLVAPDFSKEFMIQTDASEVGLGAVLSQEINREEHPILYLSGKLSTCKKKFNNYGERTSSHKMGNGYIEVFRVCIHFRGLRATHKVHYFEMFSSYQFTKFGTNGPSWQTAASHNSWDREPHVAPELQAGRRRAYERSSMFHQENSDDFPQLFILRSEDLVEVKAHSSQLFVLFNKSVWLNCSTSAPNKTFYETRLRRIDIVRGANWVAAEVIVDDWENSTLFCLYIGDGKESTSATSVLAYALPSKVTIDMVSEVEEGEEYTINCTVHEVAPLEYLTINVFRGEEVINSSSYNGPHVVDKQTVSHVYTFQASRRDNRENFTCEAVLQLGSEAKRVKSPELTVQTYALPEGPVISVQKWIKRGTLPSVECQIANAFPPENVNLKMLFDDTQLDVVIAQTNKGSINGTAELNTTDSSLGLKTIRCESNLFTLIRDSTVEVNIYEYPAIIFDLSSNIVDLDQKVTASCNITNEYPVGYVLSISVDGREELSVENSTVIYTFTASRRTPRVSITCMAHITGNPSISQSSTQSLEVHYPPDFTETLCPSTLLLVEGNRPFLCRADGNPEPTVKCYSGEHNISDSVR
ncbi:unnamed protein product [Ranitomeya imitator]|uniref:Ig-like domain-containing protein n=1 Tax=Ranitomeya imitator TaxID=111125 RepID=A0ABN9LIB3_9NEOB|nr:unnamed protein product [Ranitomeya imitator]